MSDPFGLGVFLLLGTICLFPYSRWRATRVFVSSSGRKPHSLGELMRSVNGYWVWPHLPVGILAILLILVGFLRGSL